MKEQWKDIDNYLGYYQISNLGTVKSLQRQRFHSITKNKFLSKEKILKSSFDKKGYKIITLKKEGQQQTLKIHRLVANAFIHNVYNKSQVNHINGKKDDNKVNNLEWVTPGENLKHSYNLGLHPSQKGKNNVLNISVYQYDKITGDYINEYYSAQEAMDITGTERNNICTVCKNKTKSAGGFVWSYNKKLNYYGNN